MLEYPTIRRFTAEEAMRMVDAGILGEDEPVQLLDGVLVAMSPEGPEHAYAITRLSERLREAYPGRERILEEKPLAVGTYSLPEPDVAVVRGDAGTYAHRHPAGTETVLVVEVAFSSQRGDRRKASIYAAGGVEVYWLLDLAARRLELHTMPVNGAYQVTRVLSEDDVVALPESSRSWAVRDLLPAP